MTDSVPESKVSLPLVAHLVYSFDYGGLENGIVNLINATQGEGFRHCIIALTQASDFRNRLNDPGAAIYELNKKPGKDFKAYMRCFGLLRRLRPSILHTRNIGTIDCAVIGRLAGVSCCIHGEHGWDVHDIDGTNLKYRVMRRVANLSVRQFVTVSADLTDWMTKSVGIPANKVTQICNGVDTDRFRPRQVGNADESLEIAFSGASVVIGSVLRFKEIKDPMNLVNAFIAACEFAGGAEADLRLVMIGDGPLRQVAIDALEAAGLSDKTWLPGSRDNIPDVLRSMDIFVLGSRREGVSNTLLEAMASGLPVIATDTGGNAELVRVNKTGALVAPEDSEALAREILRYAQNDKLRVEHGLAAREAAISEYSLHAMIDKYRSLYRGALTAQAEGAGKQ